MQGSATVVARSPVRPRAPRRAKRGPATRCDSARPSGDIPEHWRRRGSALTDALSLFDDLARQPPTRGEHFDTKQSAVAIEVDVHGSGLALTGNGGCDVVSLDG